MDWILISLLSASIFISVVMAMGYRMRELDNLDCVSDWERANVSLRADKDRLITDRDEIAAELKELRESHRTLGDTCSVLRSRESRLREVMSDEWLRSNSV